MKDFVNNENTKPVIGITGATGLIGSALCEFLQHKGYPVIRLIRNPSNSTDRKYSLENEPSQDLLKDIDVLIHCAYAKNDGQVETGINYTGSKLLFENARQAGVATIIFLSSIAAQTTIRSAYGQSKLAVENLLDPQMHTVIKPGLVIGNGGLFKRLLETALTKNFVPLIGKGQQSLQYLAIADLQKAIHLVIEERITGRFVLANKENSTYRDFFDQLGAYYNKKLKFVQVGASLLLAGVRIARLARISLPISRDNILGLISQQYEAPTKTSIAPTTTLEEALEALDQK